MSDAGMLLELLQVPITWDNGVTKIIREAQRAALGVVGRCDPSADEHRLV
jgi:hypothetical protein